MPAITDISPEVLRDRHRLSSQQVNAIFGRKVIEESYEEKAVILNKAGELLKVGTILRKAEIEFIPLKGPLLSYRLYSDATVRKSGDIDILIDSRDVEHVREILLAAGYSEYMVTWPTTGKGKKKALRYWHHILFNNPEGDVIVEVHWKLINRQWLNFRDASDFVRSNLCTVDFAGNSYMVLNPETELLYLVIHGGAHRWGMLKWLEDIHRYIEKSPIDNKKFCNLVGKFGCGRLVTLCNRMLSEYFQVSALLPCGKGLPRYMERMAEEAIGNPDNRGPESIREILRLLPYTLSVYPGFKYKLRLLGMVAGNSLFNGRLRRFFD